MGVVLVEGGEAGGVEGFAAEDDALEGEGSVVVLLVGVDEVVEGGGCLAEGGDGRGWVR
ncbi:predicted protein [Streptomyces iranensis]|uniref:Uncharacterized protein n=1 Tax=Streptomyces iranensis TaxID=576784 RepID=A0A060ZGA2_9ACTN|nr:predicted protein [Streptomyces iranensis]